MPDSILDQLTQSFKRFPGIGPRQAKRFVYYLLRAPKGEIENLLRLIKDLPGAVNRCQNCFRFFSSVKPLGYAASSLCSICNDGNRDETILMLVEKDIDLENIERSGTYRGYYFVLGGLVPILDKNPKQSIRAKELLERLKTKPNLKEIIIAVSANFEGDHTIEFIKNFLKFGGKISTLGRGLSTGAELEYSDSDTLKNALKHRE
jgi:recombination protein RecR